MKIYVIEELTKFGDQTIFVEVEYFLHEERAQRALKEARDKFATSLRSRVRLTKRIVNEEII